MLKDEKKLIVYPENNQGLRTIVFQNGTKATAILVFKMSMDTLVQLAETLDYRVEAEKHNE